MYCWCAENSDATCSWSSATKGVGPEVCGSVTAPPYGARRRRWTGRVGAVVTFGASWVILGAHTGPRGRRVRRRGEPVDEAEVISELYGLAPGDFTRVRNERAAQAR